MHCYFCIRDLRLNVVLFFVEISPSNSDMENDISVKVLSGIIIKIMKHKKI